MGRYPGELSRNCAGTLRIATDLSQRIVVLLSFELLLLMRPHHDLTDMLDQGRETCTDAPL
eukprot:2694716-Alexandrium_andersonii.AAC.1